MAEHIGYGFAQLLIRLWVLGRENGHPEGTHLTQILFPLRKSHQTTRWGPALPLLCPTSLSASPGSPSPGTWTQRQRCAPTQCRTRGSSLCGIQFVWHLTLAPLSAGLPRAHRVPYCATASVSPTGSQKHRQGKAKRGRKTS